MTRTHTTLVLLAALLLPCAQACRATSAGAAQAPPAQTPAAAQTPYAAPFPALARGTDAFEPFVNLSGGRGFSAREVAHKPARKDMKVRADYPVLLGDDRPAAREFNRLARTFVLDDVTPYIESDPDPEKERHPHWKDVEEYHNVSHKVVYASDELVSVLFYVEGYNWGAGHGQHKPVTLNFDLKAGREVGLAQVFKPGSDYLRLIADLCHEDLKRQFGAGGYPGGEGTAVEGGRVKPAEDSLKAWVVTREGLVFVFEEYHVVAYSQGEPKVLIPFERLREFIDPRGPLAGLAGSE
jgi:hypothetical protein